MLGLGSLVAHVSLIAVAVAAALPARLFRLQYFTQTSSEEIGQPIGIKTSCLLSFSMPMRVVG
jgi:hypothetical protein